MHQEVHVVMSGRRSSDWMSECRKQSFTNLLYGLHEGSEASTVMSWLCVVHKRVAVQCRRRLNCVGGDFDVGFGGGGGHDGQRKVREWSGMREELGRVGMRDGWIA
jgi:hypothetical protein